MKPTTYHTISQVIDHIVQNKLHQQPLDSIAQSVGMSPGHLQKLFQQWVGISPKQFGRYLTLQYAKDLLAQRQTIGQTALHAGLSSNGRLHDAFVDIEAVTPGEFLAGGNDVQMTYSYSDTVFGLVLVASTQRGICNVLFGDDRQNLRDQLQARWPQASLVEARTPAHQTVTNYLAGVSNGGQIKLCLVGTNFQIKVWEALLSIPAGQVARYKDIAEQIGQPNSARAVGTAIGNNPIGYIIPCHRVLQASGQIGGYHWGPERKQAMLGYEAIKKDS